MRYHLDTNVLSDLVQKHPSVVRSLSSTTSADQVLMSVTVRGEALYGIEKLPAGRKRQSIEFGVRKLLQDIACEPTRAEVANEYARLKLAQQRAGYSLDENDLWIAAAAMVSDATLVTRDGDFSRVAGLRIVDWTQ
jgi:tRNA(fMet)-specific endonuclease VapC